MIIMVKKDKNITENMDKWEFNEDVSQVFDEMLERSIPSYNRMRYLITRIVIEHIKKNNLTHTNILDLGCSTGEQIFELNKHLKMNEYIGLECSKFKGKKIDYFYTIVMWVLCSSIFGGILN